MAKLIIYCTGNPVINGYKRHTFHWSVHHGCYLYLGREFDETEFNQVVVKAMTEFRKHLQPLVKVVELTSPAKQLDAQTAEDYLREVAPERLKAKPGPKPKHLEALEVS